MLTVDLLRHGALQGGIKYRGRTDDPLTSEGREAMDHVWQQLADDIDCIVTSPLCRCAEPARAWASYAGIDCIIEPGLTEMNYGAWEGKTMATIQHEYPGLLERWRANPTGMRPPCGESPEELRARLTDWWEQFSETCNDAHILVVAHSGSLRMLIALMLEQTIAFTRTIDMPYACLHRIIYQHGLKTPLHQQYSYPAPIAQPHFILEETHF